MASKNRLLVEGTDDEHVVKNLCGCRGLPNIDEIRKLDGINKLLESLPTQLKDSEVKALGVIVDADTDMKARWDSLRGILASAEYTDVPAAPSTQGTILKPPPDLLRPRVGIWLMPDNHTNGILEDFLRFLVPAPNPLLDHAKQSVAGIPDGHRLFATKDDPKALIHTWLAWQEEPGKPFGTAITARYLDADVPQVTIFINWLRRLFFS